VDSKKKELVGAFRNAGRRWLSKGKPAEVSVHDFPHLGEGKAIRYGAYDIARDKAAVTVGVIHDTAEFAVESIRRWWRLNVRPAVTRRTSLSRSAMTHPAPASGARDRTPALSFHQQKWAR
jgi:hypothetical protein